ncbi:ribose operon repressor RbsR [Oceanicola granulosus HTCC2516]|uniref:Ribose operon repressor RbsR n=1 Tax=Oceanicola granulosus (strain ATCC BAA-861 / DSM 15982 / KCTC 12143 / HTCC2516) TaxID=314256 RepID=Q2CAL8_OCEGH|nr:LacI family DNA-binding transcriptional regulator [Oceanicola granulosus]EAR49734.1 ribose operon repressor RbsR [Oceanicola granulosus HTCC2516]
MATLKDIAARTGLSVNTVSLALRGSRRISSDTRRKVEDAAGALDYTPNHAAKSLISRRTMTIGLLLTDVTSPVLTQVARSVELTLKKHGYVTLLAASNGDQEEESRALATFRARQVDGMLVYPNSHDALDEVARLRDAGTPVVLLAGPDDTPLDLVCIDERHGAEAAVRHLIEIGHRRIGLMSSTEMHGNRQKQQGYADALAAAGIAYDDALVVDPLGNSASHGFEAVARLMARPGPKPTALFVDNDPLAIGALRWCQLNGVAVPDDLALVGFDNVEAGAFAAIPLTTVDYPVDQVAEIAVQRLVRRIENEATPDDDTPVRIRPHLVVRQSTAART